MKPARLSWVLAIAALSVSVERAVAQSAATLDDVPAALARVAGKALTLTFDQGATRLPPGGHVQGIQLRYDAAGRRHLAILSHDSLTHGYFVVVAFPAEGPDDYTAVGRILSVQRLPTDGQKPPLRHAGGIQLLGDVLVVGVEDNQDKLRSQVQFWNVAQPDKLVQLAHLTIHRSSTTPKDATAGAVGLAATDRGHLVAVANWDSRAIDFYESNGKPLEDPACRFELRSRWNAADADQSTWKPDRPFGNYQAINLLADTRGNVHLLGFDTTPTGQDVVDLFSIDLDAPVATRLTRIVRREFVLGDENHFVFGGGMSVGDGRMLILASPRNVTKTTRLNVVP